MMLKSVSTTARPQCRPFGTSLASMPRTTRTVVYAGKQATSQSLPEQELLVSRRDAFLAMGAAAALIATEMTSPATASAADGFVTFKGMASPPTSYGGYGGNANEAAKYTFEYPSTWKTETPNKVEKGTQGVDGRVVNQKAKDQRAFVITLARAGEDNKSFKLTNMESTFASFAGADYKLLDALSNATETTQNQVEVNGVNFFQYDIDSPEFHYLSSIAVKDGKVFALFVRSPTRTFKAAEPNLRHIIDTFKLV